MTKHFGGVTALDDVSLGIRAGEFHAIVGENGAGKSTLMKILAGVLTDYEGELCHNGERVRFSGTRDAERQGICIIHQELNLVEELTAAANIYLGREFRTRFGLLDDRAMQASAQALFDRLECEISPGQHVRELRVGDQQLVEIAKALSLQAQVLIMDEPTSALTESEVERLFRVIQQLLSDGVTIIYISHKMDEVFRLSDRITVLRDGQLVTTVNRTETDARTVTSLMVGRDIAQTDWGHDREAGDIILSVENLYLPRSGDSQQWRLKDISFSLRQREVLGIAGLMGAGRTELLECLFGVHSQEKEGRISLDGRDVDFQHPADAMQAGVALVTEDRKRLGIFAHMNVRENITLCTLSDVAGSGFISASDERKMAEESIALLDVKTSGVEAPVSALSGGNQQKCVMARWLRTQPKVLLLDDPTRGIDVGAKAEIYKVIDTLCHDGLGIVVTSSELPELLTLCDRILVLCEGRVTGEFQRSEFSEQAIIEAATQRETMPA